MNGTATQEIGATQRWSKPIGAAKAGWRFLKAASLTVSDAIIALSLLRKGARPKPGERAAWPRGLRARLRREQRGLCVYCRGKFRLNPSHIDHIIPVDQGGSNERENLQLLCAPCNLRKSDRNDREFRYRYRKLLPQQRGRMPGRRIKQVEFRAVTTETSDADSYRRFKAGKYLTAAQKVNSGALATGIVVPLGVFLPFDYLFAPQDGSILLATSVFLGIASGIGIRLRARHTGRDQED